MMTTMWKVKEVYNTLFLSNFSWFLMRKYLHNQYFPSFPITQRIFKLYPMNIRFGRFTTDLFPYSLTIYWTFIQMPDNNAGCFFAKNIKNYCNLWKYQFWMRAHLLYPIKKIINLQLNLNHKLNCDHQPGILKM